MPGDEIKESVRRRYGDVARTAARVRTRSDDQKHLTGHGCTFYELEDLAELPQEVVAASRGSGNPVIVADLQPGEKVLDLGSGAGIDVFLAAKRVAPSGKVYGLDFTEEMLAVARESQLRLGAENVEFLKADIEQIPLPDGHVDVIVSNCVVCLTTDKDAVFREAFRVLRPGGRLAISDMMFNGGKEDLPEDFRTENWCSCTGGALDVVEWRQGLLAAGFVNVQIETEEDQETDVRQDTDGNEDSCCSSVETIMPRALRGLVTARKPA